MRRPGRVRRLSCGCMLALLVAVLACTAPAPAMAADEPVIAAAGIDATDHFVATWTLAPGTTFDFVEFSTVPISNPFVPGSFAGRNVIASACAAPAEGCIAPPSLKAFRSTDPVARDRRYFVKVNARKNGRGPLSSVVWVIDKSKPTLPGGGRPATTPTNKAVLGEPYKPPNPRTIPTPKLAVQSPPKTIASLIRDGVRVQITCPTFVCYAIVGLFLGKTTLVFSDTTARPNNTGTFVLKPRPARRALLQRRKRARIDVSADVMQPGGKRTQLVKRIRVKR